MLRPFQELGDLVAARWARVERTPDAFSDIATAALAESRLLETVERADIAQWLMRAQGIPEQLDNDFGQPPVKMYQGDGFRIDALFWVDSSTSVHEHSFHGAFGVLAGGSVHSTYQFDEERRVTRRFVAGYTRFQRAELLERGDVRAIHAGHGLIHALFHLDRPSVSIVIRTSTKISDEPQYSYQRPYLALDPFHIPTEQTIQLRLLRSLLVSDRAAFWPAVRTLVATTEDPWLLYHALSIAYAQSDDAERWMDLLTHVNHRHADLLRYIIPCLRDESRALRVTMLRSSVHDATQRFFLALLLNVPTRDEIYTLIASKFPGEDVQALALQWLSDIFRESRMGIKLTSTSVFLLKLMMQDPDFERAKSALIESFGETQAADPKIRDAWMRMHAVDIFAPLWNLDTESVSAPWM